MNYLELKEKLEETFSVKYTEQILNSMFIYIRNNHTCTADDIRLRYKYSIGYGLTPFEDNECNYWYIIINNGLDTYNYYI